MAISERVLSSDEIFDPLAVEDSLAVKVLAVLVGVSLAEWKIDNLNG